MFVSSESYCFPLLLRLMVNCNANKKKKLKKLTKLAKITESLTSFSRHVRKETFSMTSGCISSKQTTAMFGLTHQSHSHWWVRIFFIWENLTRLVSFKKTKTKTNVFSALAVFVLQPFFWVHFGCIIKMRIQVWFTAKAIWCIDSKVIRVILHHVWAAAQVSWKFSLQYRRSQARANTTGWSGSKQGIRTWG